MKRLTLLIFSFCSSQFLFGQNAPTIEWQKCLGGSNWDFAKAVQQTADGGFIVSGYTYSNDFDVSGSHGNTDEWVVKLDSSGAIEWQKCLGGTGNDEANSIQQTTDGGFIVAGYSGSNDGDVSGNHGGDYWVVKLDTAGNIVWQKCLGGTGSDQASSIRQTFDGGFIVAGITYSNDGDVSGYHGSADYWIVKLDSSGNLLWQKSLGGSGYDNAQSIQQTNDGGFVVVGWTSSNNGDVTTNLGNYDGWLVKLDSTGNLMWQKSLGGIGSDQAFSVQEIGGSNIIVGGWTNSNTGDLSSNHGLVDYWVSKLDAAGNLIWQKCWGGSDDDFGKSIEETIDSGFIIAGISYSNDGDVSGNHGWEDYWVVKIDSTGIIQWQKSLGGYYEDEAYSIKQTADEGFIIAGYTSSNNNGDITGWHPGYDDNEPYPDYWIVKLGPDIPTTIKNLNSTLSFFISPNPGPGNFQLTFPTSLHQHATLSITNLLGQKLFGEEIPVNSSQQAFDFSHWQKGMYFITLRDENSFGQERLVIQ